MNSKIKSFNHKILEKFLLSGLQKHNYSKSTYFKKNGYANEKKFSFCATIDGKIIGGIQGWIKCTNWVYIDLLYVDEKHRNLDIATNLMKRVEEFATKNKCFGIVLETWSFQAKKFYEKMGYIIFGILENSPQNETEYYFKKVLK